jgi:hypothetical protein
MLQALQIKSTVFSAISSRLKSPNQSLEYKASSGTYLGGFVKVWLRFNTTFTGVKASFTPAVPIRKVLRHVPETPSRVN